MQPIALYSKYRPTNWGEVLGQEHVVSTLSGSLQSGDIAHAYLFAGSHGTGKTSVARIMAREMGVEGNDLYEIDAASNRGIDDIRELREAVHALPLTSPYKCYIIDEAHMLTREAFNALLKTLEEPPSHCKFILATTEISKLPDTVVSRCQVHIFRKPSNKIIKDALTDIAEKEGFDIDAPCVELIAVMADGSFRDALGLLQKILGSADASVGVKIEDVAKILGAPSTTLVSCIVTALADGDSERALTAISDASRDSLDMALLAKMLLSSLRYILLLRYAGGMEEHIRQSVAEDEFTILKDLSGKRGASINSRTILEFLMAMDQIPRTAISELPLELAIVKLLGERAEPKKAS